MTARQSYEYSLIEINKLEAPSLTLDGYNYLINKAIQQYVNKAYNKYEMNQQATDDLRVLKATAALSVSSVEDGLVVPNELKEYYCTLPEDYFHLLNCVVSFTKNGKDDTPSRKKCPNKNPGGEGSALIFPARKLTADIYPSILVNAYLKPDYKRPYYFITNIKGEDVYSPAQELEKLLKGESYEERPSEGIKMQLRCGNNSKYIPSTAYIDYIKAPELVHLSYEDLDLIDGKDRSQVLEFPDYVCFEIINELVKLVLENSSDPRLQTNVPINQTIANPLPQ